MPGARRLSAGSRRTDQRLSVRLDIIFTDASTGPTALDVVDVHTQFARQAADMGSGRDRLALLCARHLAQLRGHSESLRNGKRLVRRQRLLFRLAFGAHCSLECQTGGLLPGNDLHGSVFRRLRRCGRSPSRVKITCPTLTFSPSLTRTSFTTPLTEEGTSTTALSVSSSITGWPSDTFAPGEIIRRTRSPWSMFSPSSGSLNSFVAPADEALVACAGRGAGAV